MTGKHDFKVIVWRSGVAREPPEVGFIYEDKLNEFVLRDRTLDDAYEYMHDYCANRSYPCFWELFIWVDDDDDDDPASSNR